MDNYEDNVKVRLNPIQKEFFDLVRSSSLLNNIHLQDEYLTKFKQLLQNPDTEKYIHIDQLKDYNLVPHGTVLHNYLANRFEEHNNKILISIKTDDIDFIKNHFVNWFENKTKNYDYKDDTDNEMIILFKIAVENNSTEVIKYFLTDKDLLSKFRYYIYQKEELSEALRSAVDNNNTDLIQFLTQSISIKNNPTIDIIDLKNNHDNLEKKTIEFITQKLITIKNISEEFERFAQQSHLYIYPDVYKEAKLIVGSKANDVLPFSVFTKNLEIFLNSELLAVYPIEHIKGMQLLLNTGAKTNNTQLVQYLLTSETLLYKSSSIANNQESYVNACRANSIEVVEILIPHMYQEHLKHDLLKDKPFILNAEGLNATCLFHWNDLTKKILEYKEPKETEFHMAFYSACNTINIDIIPTLIEKSMVQLPAYKRVNSPILDDYPYYNIMEAVLMYNAQQNNEEKIVKLMDYLFNEPNLNPNTYKNYQNHLPKKSLTLDSLFLKVFNSGKIKVIDYFISSENPNIKPTLSPYINENLVKFLFETKISQIEPKTMMDYLINEVGIKRTPTLHNYLQDLIDYGSTGSAKEQRHKILAQYAMDIYDVLDFNEKLEQQVNNIAKDKISPISVKKKI